MEWKKYKGVLLPVMPQRPVNFTKKEKKELLKNQVCI